MQRFRYLTTRIIPENSTKIEHALGVAYVRESRGKYEAVAYSGRAIKPAFYEAYRHESDRAKRVADFFTGLEQHAALKATWAAERTAPHSLKPGDIIHHSWGWEQTQCDFYQITDVTPHGATIRAIGAETVPGSEGFMSCRYTAIKDNFTGEPLKVKINGRNTVTTLKHGHASLWDGRPEYCSWYA